MISLEVLGLGLGGLVIDEECRYVQTQEGEKSYTYVCACVPLQLSAKYG